MRTVCGANDGRYSTGQAPPAELRRAPVVENNRGLGWLTDKLTAFTEGKTPRWWWMLFLPAAFFATVVLPTMLIYQISTGIGVWGNNHPVMWGWDIIMDRQKTPDFKVTRNKLLVASLNTAALAGSGWHAEIWVFKGASPQCQSGPQRSFAVSCSVVNPEPGSDWRIEYKLSSWPLPVQLVAADY